MMTGETYFTDALKAIPEDIKKQVDWSMSVSDAIARTLSERGMSQKEFARLMGKTETEVSRWLAGRHNFTIATLAKISVALGTDLVRIV
jgi:plasmid maintenance system antidote protein VapI